MPVLRGELHLIRGGIITEKRGMANPANINYLEIDCQPLRRFYFAR